MPPRHHQTLPPAQTSSARDAQRSFYCNLCAKGYSRTNDFEAHLSSYDHSHKQRLKDMKAMVRDPNAGAKARKAEAKADGLVSINLAANVAAGTGGGGSKKGGFKKSGFKSAFAPVKGHQAPPAPSSSAASSASSAVRAAGNLTRSPTQPGILGRPALQTSSLVESDTEDEGYQIYDPRFPTD